MRIISGQFKGRRLKSLTGLGLRPTSDRLKETLFNIIAPSIRGARFLDCFAGSGAIGLEALSRGAEKVWVVEKNPETIEIIRQNVDHCRVVGGIEILPMEVMTAIKHFADTKQIFDIIFMDPPYQSDLYEKVIARIAQTQILSHEGTLIVEHNKRLRLIKGFGSLACYRAVQEGDSMLSFYARGRVPG